MIATYHTDYEQFSSGYFMNAEVPSGYSDYGQLDQQRFIDRASLIADMDVDSVLIAGCGYGYTVDHLVELGINAYGIDISDFAVSRAPAAVVDRIFTADLMSDMDLMQITNQTADGMFDLIVTETCMSCFTDEACKDICDRLSLFAKSIVHIVYTEKSDIKPEYYNIKPIQTWREMSNHTWLAEKEVRS